MLHHYDCDLEVITKNVKAPDEVCWVICKSIGYSYSILLGKYYELIALDYRKHAHMILCNTGRQHAIDSLGNSP